MFKRELRDDTVNFSYRTFNRDEGRCWFYEMEEEKEGRGGCLYKLCISEVEIVSD